MLSDDTDHINNIGSRWVYSKQLHMENSKVNSELRNFKKMTFHASDI